MDFVKTFEKKNKPQFQKYKKYFNENDWSTPQIERDENGKITFHKYYFIKDVKFSGVTFEGKEGEYKIQHAIAKTVLDRLSHFVDKTKADKDDPKVRRVIKQMYSILKLHLDRIDKYITSSSAILGEVEEVDNDDNKTERDYKSDEIDFDNICYKNQAELEDKINKLDILEDKKSKETSIEFLNNAKAPLSMHHVLSEMYPEIKRTVESMEIDFETPPKNEMLIHIENPPEWNEDKHYFEQDKKTLQFYVDEYKKIENGITVDGVYISGWMYCHLNIFKTPIPEPIINKQTGEQEVKDIIKNPPLRDNEWFIIQDNYEAARKQDKMMFLCATRRGAKTTLIASHLYHKALTKKRTLVVAGGSSKDLGQIEGNFGIALAHAYPAFAVPNITDDWTKEVKIGIKKKNQKDILLCTLNIVNLNAGGEKASERLAGFTPDAFVLDECMKNPFLDQLNAAKPAFDSPYGKRLVALLSGTGSANEDLVADALKILARPDDEGILNMPWEALERGIPKEHITWKRRNFGTFLPGQMSAKTGMVKIEKTLSEYLQLEPNPKLDKIKILVTNWEGAIEKIKEDRKKLEGNKKSLQKEIVYYPTDPEEIFLSGKTNPFPQEEIKRYLARIIEEGDTGKKVTLDYDEKGNVKYELSDKEYPEIPYGGGFHDAPVTIFEDPIPDAPFEFYVAGHDGYKQEQSDGDSIGSFSIIRRDTGKVVASYHSRPDPSTTLHRQGYLLLEMYNAPVFMENADMDFKTYTDGLGFHVTDKYLVKSLDFLGDMSMDSNGRRLYGWTPTPKNKNYLLGLLLNYTKEQVKYEDEEGKVRTRWGFERIKDIRILQEMINFKPGGNYDTISALMGAIGYDYYLTFNYGAPKILSQEEKAEREKRKKELKKTKKVMGLFPRSRGRLFH